ncbi:MAG: hypothetical protein A2161_02590 [Candidatus Schekmanbacteria bacterium RBG_13_48_7]|uniref:N-acetyltransferase domain-containing protein n=1 Tax=Candidatus Schekmanbacteria bacterium RBG_13_48_7 TaxID=1817878 RepID=A0A1F7S2S7_9BACT|nr:MAG: hypothetical protein A2161_02590 [Candidatus Schekmanbacteria bacterium RBG_13_48_7]
MTHKSKISCRHFQPTDTDEWIRVHGIVASFSSSWIFIINKKPVYRNDSIELVADRDNAIVGFIDVEIEPHPGALCLKDVSRGGFVWEIGVLPELQKKGIGRRLIKEAEIRLTQKGIRRMEFFTRDENACKFYEKLQMEKISTHYQFFFKPPANIARKFIKKGILNTEHIFATCWEDDWEDIKKKFSIIYNHPYEPHICTGFEYTF